MFVQRFQRIGRTGRLKTAGRRHQGRQQAAMNMDGRGQQCHGDPARAILRFISPAWSCLRCAAFNAPVISASRAAKARHGGAAHGQGSMVAVPRPAKEGSTCDAAARSRRLARLRVTALPTLRLAVKPIRRFRTDGIDGRGAPGFQGHAAADAPDSRARDFGGNRRGSSGGQNKGTPARPVAPGRQLLAAAAASAVDDLAAAGHVCANGSHGGACARSCSAGRCASWSSSGIREEGRFLEAGRRAVNVSDCNILSIAQHHPRRGGGRRRRWPSGVFSMPCRPLGLPVTTRTL